MSINLLKMLQDQMGDSVVEQASKFLGESASTTSSGIASLLPSLMGGLISKGSSESGANGILDMLTKGSHDGGILDSLGSVFGGGSSTSNFMNAGSLLTSALFGGSKLGNVLDIVTKVTGMRRSSSSSLMNLLAPIVMGMIGKQVKSGGLNAKGLMDMLMGQKDHVASALPAGMGSMLGFADMKDTVTAAASRTASAARETVRETAEVATDTAKAGGSMLRWALPLVALIGLGAWLFTRNGAETVASVAGDGVEMMKDGAKTAANAAGDAATKTVEVAGDAVTATGNAMENAADKAGDMAKDGANAVGNAADKAGNMVKDGANAVGKAADKAGNMVKDGADAVGNVANKAGAALSATGLKAQKTFASMIKKGSTATAYSLNDITFDKTGNKITDFNKDEVMALAATLKANPKAKIQVQAYSNDGKNAVQNKAITTERAKLVQQMLETLGVKASQISSKGMSASDQAKANTNAIQVVVK